MLDCARSAPLEESLFNLILINSSLHQIYFESFFWGVSKKIKKNSYNQENVKFFFEEIEIADYCR